MSLWLFHPFIGVSMNANELADELREVSKHSEPHTQIVLGIAESLLRQQQAEIEALKVKAHEWYLIAMGKAQEK